MWAKCGGCCCPDRCTSHGTIQSACADAEIASLYTPTALSSGGTVETGPGAGASCYSLPPLMVYDSDCFFLGQDAAGDYHTEFEIFDDSSAEFRVVWDSGPDAGKYLTWIPRELHSEPFCNPITGRTFDPLCTSVFQYSEEDSDPPDDCLVDRCLCITPNNNCCESGEFREDSLPLTLSATLEFSCETATPPSGADSVMFTMTWNNETGQWEAVVEGVCDGTLTVALRCVCTDTFDGCGTGTPCYDIIYSHDGCGSLGGPFQNGSDSCACDPFEIVFTLSGLTIGCCGAECTALWELTITE